MNSSNEKSQVPNNQVNGEESGAIPLTEQMHFSMDIAEPKESLSDAKNPTDGTSIDSTSNNDSSKLTEEKMGEKTTNGEDDADEDEEESAANLFRINSGLLPFPEKLMSLLDGDKVADAMWWLPDGDCFCLIPVLFAEQVLDKHFQGTKFESFTRKLNRWGFKRVAGQKVPTNTIAYYNKNFLRGKPKLLKNMNGGKTKFISAREKRMRAQLKRERDREQAVLIASQQQALYSEQMGLGSMGLSPGASGGFMRPNLDNMRLQSLLASRPMGFQQQADDMRVSEHVFAAEQALAAQQQREQELQMRLLRGGGGGMGLSNLRDPRELAASSQWLARNSMNNQQSQFSNGSLSGYDLSQLRGRGPGDAPMNNSSGVDMTAEQLLLARQMAAGNNNNNHNNMPSNMAQRLMAQRMGSAGFNGMNQDDAAVKMVQQRMEEEQRMKMKMAQQGSPGQKPVDQRGQIDPQLFHLYLLDQQRKKEMSLNARQA